MMVIRGRMMTHDGSAAEVVLRLRFVGPDVTQGRCRRSALGFHMENPRPRASITSPSGVGCNRSPCDSRVTV